jgi:hypothetical protein
MDTCLMFRNIPEFEQKPRPRKWALTLNTSSGGCDQERSVGAHTSQLVTGPEDSTPTRVKRARLRVTISTQASISRSSEGTQEVRDLKSICIDKLVYRFWYSPRSKPQTSASRTLGSSTSYYNDMIMGGHIIDNVQRP